MDVNQLYQMANEQANQWATAQNPQGSGYGITGGGTMGGGGYQSYLRDLINANPNNPEIQQMLFAQMISSMDPGTQQAYTIQQQQLEQQKLEYWKDVALSLLTSEDPADKLEGREIILNLQQGIIPGGTGYGISPEGGTGTGGGTNITWGMDTTPAPTSGYNTGDYQIQALGNLYGEMPENETDPSKLALYSLLNSEDPEVASTYFGAEPKLRDRAWKWLVPFDGESWWNATAGRKTRENEVRRAYGL